MPDGMTGAVLVAALLAGLGYFYVGKPVAHEVRKAGSAIVHVFHHPKKAGDGDR